MRPESSIQIEDVSLNTARIGFVRTLERMGAQVSVAHTGAAGKEPYGIIEACYTPDLRGCEVPADKIAGIIDEIPCWRWWRRTRMESPCSVKWGSFV